MLKVCFKKNCNDPASARGKYCENHRTNKPKIKPIIGNNILMGEEIIPIIENNYEEDINLALKLSLETLNIEKKHVKEKFEEDRQLRIDQEYEFNETMKLDIERLEKDNKRAEEIENKRLNSIKSEPTDDKEEYFNIKIKLSNRSLIRKFKYHSKIKDIRDYLDVYFEDNKINIKNYNLVINQSSLRKLLIIDNNLTISSLKLSNNFILFLENLDA